MAKAPPRSTTVSKVKVRVFEFEMDGSDESIQDTMKTLAAALSRGGHHAPPMRRIKTENASSSAIDSPDIAEEVEEIEDPDGIEDATPKPPSAPRKPRKVQTFDILDDIRLDKTEITLSNFVALYSQPSDLKRYLIIASWFKDQLKLTEINVRHWFTAFKYLKWSIPTDPTQPIRDLRRQKKLSNGVAPGHVSINHIGEKDIEANLKTAQ